MSRRCGVLIVKGSRAKGHGRGRALPLRGGEPAPLLFVRRHLREEVEAVLRGRPRPALPLPVGVDLPRGGNRFKCSSVQVLDCRTVEMLKCWSVELLNC